MTGPHYGHSFTVTIPTYNPDKPDNDGRTPLLYAAWYGHEEVMTILLKQDGATPDMPDNDGRTPLSFAASGGHAEVMKILLEWGEINPDKPDNDGRTSLSYAAQGGHERVANHPPWVGRSLPRQAR